MSHTFLMEIGLEEIPAHVVTPMPMRMMMRKKPRVGLCRWTFWRCQLWMNPRVLSVF